MTKSIGNFNYLHSAASHLQVFKSNRKGDFSLLQWSEVLSRWLAKDICLCCDSCVKMCLHFYCSLYSSPFISPSLRSLDSSTYLCSTSSLMRAWIFMSFKRLLFGLASHEERNKAADCDASFIFINHRRECYSKGLGRSGLCCSSWMKPSFFQFKTKCSPCLVCLYQSFVFQNGLEWLQLSVVKDSEIWKCTFLATVLLENQEQQNLVTLSCCLNNIASHLY